MADSECPLFIVVSKPSNINLIAKYAFKVADKDSNGVIDIDEFGECMKNVSESFGLNFPEKEKIKLEFDRLDEDKNGIIDFEEFKKFVKEIINRMFFKN